MDIPIRYLLPLLLVFFLGNGLIYWHIIRQGRVKIESHLRDLGYTLIRLRRPGLISSGHFNERRFYIGGFHSLSRTNSWHYRYVDFVDTKGHSHIVTAKIKWNLFRPMEVEFKPDLLRGETSNFL